jgi:hypothetical protein
MSERLPSALVIANIRGWSTDHSSYGLRKGLAGRYDVLIRYHDDVTAEEIDAAGVVLLHFWSQFFELARVRETLLRSRHKLVVSAIGMRGIEGPYEAPAVEVFRNVPSAVIGISADIVAYLRERLAVPVYEAVWGVDTELFTPAPRPAGGPLRVGWAGSLESAGAEIRGVHEFIVPAVAAVEGAELVTAMREDRWRPHAEMPGFYRGLDVYVCASRSEGTPTPALEAAACGCVLVSTKVGTMPELIEDGVNGFLVERTVEAIAGRLRELRDDEALRERLGGAMLETIRGWDWRVRAQAFADVFDAVRANVPGPARAPETPPSADPGAPLPRVVALVQGTPPRALAEHLAAQGVEVASATSLADAERLAAELDADWFLSLLPGETPLAPEGQTLQQALATAEARGYNAVDFSEQLLVSTSPHQAPRPLPFAPRYPHRVIAWRRQEAHVALASSHGEQVEFAGASVAPWSLTLQRALSVEPAVMGKAGQG